MSGFIVYMHYASWLVARNDIQLVCQTKNRIHIYEVFHVCVSHTMCWRQTDRRMDVLASLSTRPFNLYFTHIYYLKELARETEAQRKIQTLFFIIINLDLMVMCQLYLARKGSNFSSALHFCFPPSLYVGLDCGGQPYFGAYLRLAITNRVCVCMYVREMYVHYPQLSKGKWEGGEKEFSKSYIE